MSDRAKNSLQVANHIQAQENCIFSLPLLILQK